jgi:choice-of-anchor C domain-containing protein
LSAVTLASLACSILAPILGVSSMGRRIASVALIVGLVAAGYCSAADAKAPLRYTLPVELFSQEQDCWCWAACSQMVMSYYDVRVSQTVQANKRFGRTDCGQRPAPGPCNQGGFISLPENGFTIEQADHTLSQNEIIHQIYHLRKPIMYAWDFTGGGSHVMVLVGYQILNDNAMMIEYLDPMPMPYQDPKNPHGGTRVFCTYDEWCANDCHKLQPGPIYNIEKPVSWAVNLLLNGSFEMGPDVGDFLSLDKGSTALKGWIVTRGQIDYVNNQWIAADGGRCIDLHGSPGYGGVQQTFKTEKGKKYKLTFMMAGNPDGAQGVKKLAASAAGKTQEFSFDVTGKTDKALGWKPMEWEFIATDDDTTLELYTLETTDPNCGPVIDNVKVVMIYERK